MLLEGFTESDMVVLNLGTSEVGHKNSTEIVNLYQNLLSRISKVAPHCKICILSVSHRLGDYSAACNDVADQVSKALKSICAHRGNCMYINANPDTIQSNFRYDGIHFSLKGRLYFVNSLVNRMKQHAHFPLTLQNALK